jgi:uncharacterized protein (DUF924 family)
VKGDGAQAMMIAADWVSDVLGFWFEETRPEQWFKKDPAFDASVRRRFLALHEILADRPGEELSSDARTALASIIVFDQMSRNMFRNKPGAFATDGKALGIAVAVVAQGLDAGMTKDERMFCYLPFEHAEDPLAQDRCVALMASLGDPELTKWAEAHRVIIHRFGRFPHRNEILGRPSTPEEIAFLKEPGSSF